MAAPAGPARGEATHPVPVLPKEILRVGTYHTPEGVVEVTPRRIRHWVLSFRRMREAGLQVPAPWEHQDGAKPMSGDDHAASRAKNNAGFLKRLWLGKDGSLWGGVEVPDADAERVKNNVKYVSPELEPEFTDGEGRVWRDVITHLALTPRPVFAKQRPFGTKPPRMSLGRVRLSLEQLSMAGKTKKRMSKEQEDADEALNKGVGGTEDDTDETGAAKLSGDADADDPADPDGEALDEGDGPAPEPAEEPDYFEESKKQLSQMGVSMPEHCTPETFQRDLSIALHAINNSQATDMSGDAGDEDDDDDLLEDDDVDGDEKAVKEQPLMMSLRKQVREQEETISALLAEKRSDRIDRYEREGRCSPARAAALRQSLSKARLSFGRKRPTAEAASIDAQLDAIAETPRGTFAPGGKKGDGQADQGGGARRLSAGGARREERRDAWEPASGVTPERGREAAAEQLKNSGVRV